MKSENLVRSLQMAVAEENAFVIAKLTRSKQISIDFEDDGEGWWTTMSYEVTDGEKPFGALSVTNEFYSRIKNEIRKSKVRSLKCMN